MDAGLDPQQIPAYLPPPKAPLKFIYFCSKRHLRWMFAAVLAVTTAIMLGRALIVVIKTITDSAIAAATDPAALNSLWYWAILFPILHVVTEMVWRVSGFCGMRWSTGAVAEAYDSLFAYLSRHSAGYFNDRYAGALTNKISNASAGAEHMITQSLWHYYPLLIGFLADIALFAHAHTSLGVVLALWLTFYILLNFYMMTRLQPLAKTQAERSSELKGKIVDSASNIETVQQTGDIAHERNYIFDFVTNFRLSSLKRWIISEWILVTNGLLLGLFMATMLSLSVWFVAQGTLSVGSLVMILTLIMGIERSLFFIGQSLAHTASYVGQLNEGLEEILKPHSIVDSQNAKPLKLTRGKIQIKAMDFAYGEKLIFSDFSLHIRADERLGLIGLSGAGKSTLVSLLLRQFEVRSGSILIDEQNICEVTLDSLRSNIAVVPQNTSLFHRTIRENIRYGRLGASDEEIVEAAKHAQAHTFIESLPNGYDSLVGERGIKLSGGQRQRIAIARAFLKNAPILVLDEATSSLDSESERAIQRSLVGLMRGKTVIAIAHRLSTLRAMDRLVVIEKGKIIEDGDHDKLLAQGGLYARLWNSQVGGFIQE